ncbi:sporulation protein YtxC [Alicyclobacillus shizuokensis]|uniref:sporulation protein YtxC n=1 Tax=Alicyclobacillus shizuokensis TaxID=392014 RepID=UPI000836AFA1|nr:sporulation protein YtxC [Alicyclobacillus shizuokensis]MCL6626523.1 putative sporulation protein YtxC [Alicyclobacillus shizuokensis]
MRSVRIQVKLALPALSRRLSDAGCGVQRLDDTWLVVSGGEEQLLSVLHAFILSDWQYEYIQHRLSLTHPELTEEQREYISLLTVHRLRGPQILADHKFAAAGQFSLPSEQFASQLRASLAELVAGEVLHVEGLVRFRGRRYLQVLQTAMEEMVEQVLTDQEYEEFVAMLRYILDVQQPSRQRLHVFCADERVWICDDDGQLVRDQEVSSAAAQACPGEDVNGEDLAMSILITRSPEQIVIHDLSTRAPWPSFAETVERVFLERSLRCGDCPTCRRLRENGEIAPM